MTGVQTCALPILRAMMFIQMVELLISALALICASTSKNICEGKMTQATAFASWDKCLKYIDAVGGLSGEMGRREIERPIIS